MSFRRAEAPPQAKPFPPASRLQHVLNVGTTYTMIHGRNTPKTLEEAEEKVRQLNAEYIVAWNRWNTAKQTDDPDWYLFDDPKDSAEHSLENAKKDLETIRAKIRDSETSTLKVTHVIMYYDEGHMAWSYSVRPTGAKLNPADYEKFKILIETNFLKRRLQEYENEEVTIKTANDDTIAKETGDSAWEVVIKST